MTLITKRRIYQKRMLIAVFVFLLVCFVAFFFQWIYVPLTTNFGGPDFAYIKGGTPATARWHQICQGFQLDKWMTTVVNFPFPLLPLMPSIFAYNFLKEKSGYFTNAYTRIGDYRRFMWKSVGVHALLSGVYFYATYLVFLAVGMVLSATVFYDNTVYGAEARKVLGTAWAINPHYYTKSFLANVFGKYFFNHFPIEFYVLFGLVATFVFGVVYGLFTISVSFLTDKKYLSVLIPYIYFVFGSLLFSLLLNRLLIFAPISTFGALAFNREGTLSSVLPLAVPLLFSLVVLRIKIHRGDKLGF